MNFPNSLSTLYVRTVPTLHNDAVVMNAEVFLHGVDVVLRILLQASDERTPQDDDGSCHCA